VRRLPFFSFSLLETRTGPPRYEKRALFFLHSSSERPDLALRRPPSTPLLPKDFSSNLVLTPSGYPQVLGSDPRIRNEL